MALYQNDVQIRLNAQEIKKIEEHFHGKFPVKVTYPPERIVKSRLPHNRLPDKPNSISFDLKAIVKTPEGVETWRYATDVTVDKNGQKKYFPRKFLFSGSTFLGRNDIELIYFLLRKSEYCQGGNNQGPMVKFRFEDLVTEAEKKANKRRIQAKVDKFLYDDEYQLSEDKIRAVAKAYQITGVDDLKLVQVKILLGDRIFASKGGPDEFFRMIDDDEEIKARTSITKAMDMGVLKYDAVKSNWFWQATGEKGITIICKAPPTKTPNVAIYDYYLGNNAFREDLAAVLLTKNPQAGKKKEKEPATTEE